MIIQKDFVGLQPTIFFPTFGIIVIQSPTHNNYALVPVHVQGQHPPNLDQFVTYANTQSHSTDSGWII